MNKDLFVSPEAEVQDETQVQLMPLAARMRPATLQEYCGQEHIVSPGKPLYEAVTRGHLFSMILWGEAGVGKTSFAQLLAKTTKVAFKAMSAVMSGINEIREAVAWAGQNNAGNRRCILFVDEVHRFNKSQQDAFLPHIEKGTFTFIGATTENPSFSLNNALLSRARVYRLKPLNDDALLSLLRRALTDEERGLGSQQLKLTPDVEKMMIQAADGDARKLLNILEIVADFAERGYIQASAVKDVISGGSRRFDRGGDIFYDQLSAFHKSIRGSDPDAALYWFACMVESGADPSVLLRRLTAIASEDIGNADPRALDLAINAWQVWERLGHPEGLLAISQAIVYCALAPKSNAVYRAMNAAFADARQSVSHDVPLHLRNAPTPLMKALGCHQQYRYAHDEPNAFAAGQAYFPDSLGKRVYYKPSERGLEIKLAQKARWLEEQNRQAEKTVDSSDT